MKQYGFCLLALMAFGGDASAKVLSCDGCTPQQMFATADRYLQGGGPVEPAYVNNLENMTVRKYGYYNNWTPDFDPENDGLISWTEEMPVEAEITAFVQRMPMLPSMARALAYSAGNITSAWEVVNNPSNEALLIAAIRENQPILMWGNELVGYLRSVNPFSWYKPEEVVTAIIFTFPDGSTMLFDINKRTGLWEKIKGSAKDSNNNIIPEKKEDFFGEKDSERVYEFRNENAQADLDNFLYKANFYQIPITGSQGSGSSYGLACSVADGIAHCIFVQR